MSYLFDTGNGNSLLLHCGAVNSETEFILIHLVMHQIAGRLSYYAVSMHGIGISGILIMTLGSTWYH
jgi:hypothetical protein